MKTLCVALVAAVALATVFCLGRITKSCPPPDVRVDTVVTYDTIRETVPEYITRYVVRIDSIAYPIEVVTEIRNVDTLYIPINIERIEYRTPEYFAVVEGYKASLHYIETYNKTVTVDRETVRWEKPKWGLGVQIGYGTDFQKFKPYIGVGLQYNFITF